MENASKALIIAGAILIAIVLISVGIIVVNGAQSTINEGMTRLSQQEKQMFNQQFSSYDGTQKGAQVRTLIEQVITSNNQNFEIEGKAVALTIDGEEIVMDGNTAEAADEFAKTANTAKRTINTGATYLVEVNTSAATGLVNNITITKNTK